MEDVYSAMGTVYIQSTTVITTKCHRGTAIEGYWLPSHALLLASYHHTFEPSQFIKLYRMRHLKNSEALLWTISTKLQHQLVKENRDMPIAR